ncbi:uncharacterized protein LOC135205069 [Macrobrachium nipponense]|uniref:uncharacterized protein LOC135205069 n=1 Tax=Macrobrachium nipponense TaxID=159736 RepID=UPI0030C7E006
MTTMLTICLLVLVVGQMVTESTASPHPDLNCSLEVDSPSENSKGGSGPEVGPQTKNCSPDRGDQTRVPAALLPSSGDINASDDRNGQSSLSPGAQHVRHTSLESVDRHQSELDLWRCLMRRARASRLEEDEKTKKKPAKTVRYCTSDVRGANGTASREGETSPAEEGASQGDCLPLLFFLFPTLCNETRLCVNLTEASLDTIPQRFWLWNRKKKAEDEGSEAVVYIVVVLAFYSFGIVFMMANFIRQEQRELEETKLYKQYVKVARDRWLTSRGNMANKLALQALNTFNAVPQTTDDNKITFV